MTTAFDPNATDFGTDVYLQDDLSPVWGLASGDINYALACGRRISQRQGSMDFYDEKYACFDIRSYLNSKLDKVRLSQLQGKIAATQVNDPRTLRSRASATYDRNARALNIEVQNDTAEGPFLLVLQASAVSVDLLAVNGVALPEPITLTAGGAADAAGGITIVTSNGIVGPPGPAGTSHPSRSFGLQAIEDDSGTETAQIQTQLEFNWSAFGSTVTVEVIGTGMADSGTGTFRLRINGSDGGKDGTQLLAFTASSPTYTIIGGITTIANPGGASVRAIMTVESPGVGIAARMRDITLVVQSL